MKLLIRFVGGTMFASLLSMSAQAASTSLVNHDDAWRYHKGTNAPDSTWKTMADAALDGTWLSGQGGFGYGSDATETNNCKTILPDMRGAAVTNYTTLYMRKTFTIANAVATNLHLFLRMDWDNGYIAWLDGNYLTNAYVSGAPTEPPNSATANASHECSTGQTGSAAVTNDLGIVGNRLGLGDHVLAIIGLNQTASSGDFIQVADFFLDAVAVPPGITNGVGGTLAADTTWYATNSPYNVTSTVTVASNVTLTIEPGVTVRFRQVSGMNVNGRLLAEGTEDQHITFTRASGATTWERLMFVNAADSRLRHCLIEYANCAGDHKDYYPTNCSPPIFRPRNNYHEAVVALACHIEIEGCVFQNLPAAGGEGDAIAIISDHPNPTDTNSWNSASATVRNCQFLDIGQGVHTRYAYVLVEGCTFIGHNGDNDDVDLYGESSPVPLVRNNMFLYAHDDFINPTRCSAIITDNVFVGTNDTDHIIVLRDVCRPIVMNNLLYRGNAGGISVQNGCDALIAHNTLVNCNSALKMFDHLDRIAPPYCLTATSGKATLVNNIIWNSTPAFNLAGNAFGTLDAEVSYSDIQGGTNNTSLGTRGRLVGGPGNIDVDPLFVNAAVTNFHLRAGSPAIDAGTNLSAIVTTDFDGLPRPLDGDGAGGAAFDIGAYEFFLPTADSNGDGIPDGWCQHYAFNPIDPTVAAGNPDDDPFTNLEEYIADTNPTNALSWFHIAALSNGPPWTVYFPSSTNRQYTLFYSTNVVSGVWTNVPGQMDLPGRGGMDALSDTNVAPERFYRMGVKAP